MTTETPTPGNDNPGGARIGTAPSPEAYRAALAAFDEVEGAAPPGDAAGDRAEPAEGGGKGKGKGRRREVDPKELEADGAEKKGPEAEKQPTTADFKALRRDRRAVEALKVSVESGQRQLEQLRTQFKERLDRADAFDAFERELKTSPGKVLRRLGIDLSAANTQYFAENDPQSQFKSLAEQLEEVKKQLAERDKKAEESQRAAAEAQAIASAVSKVVAYTDQVDDEYEAAAFFKKADPRLYEKMVQEAVTVCARETGTVLGDEVIGAVDEYFKASYLAIKAQLRPGDARTSAGPTTTAKLETRAPKNLGRAASTPVANKDPESYEERYKAALAELG